VHVKFPLLLVSKAGKDVHQIDPGNSPVCSSSPWNSSPLPSKSTDGLQSPTAVVDLEGGGLYMALRGHRVTPRWRQQRVTAHRRRQRLTWWRRRRHVMAASGARRRRRQQATATSGGQRRRKLCKAADLLGQDVEASWIYWRGKQNWREICRDESGMEDFAGETGLFPSRGASPYLPSRGEV
jgi:hypothetical protein